MGKDTHLQLDHHLDATTKIRKRIVGINTHVPLLNGTTRPYVFLDNAASTPVLKEVLDTINEFMPWYSSIHRGSGFKSKIASAAYDEARKIVLDFFGGNDKDHVVIFGKNTTEAINKLSYRLNLTKDDVVLVGMTEHHSNDLPWRQVATVHHIDVDKEGRLLESHLDELLEKYKDKIKLVAISGGANVTGLMPDTHKIAAKTHELGAQIIVDCAQLAPHRQIDIRSLDDIGHIDYISVSAHKMYAPFGTGALIGRRDIFEQGAPELCGGGTINVVTKDSIEWAAPPDREEAGSPNVVGVVAFAKALKCLSEIGMGDIAAHEAELTSYAINKLKRIDGVKFYGDSNPDNASNRLGVIPINIADVPHDLVAAILNAEWGIGVRNGCFCAHPYVTHLLGVPHDEIARFRNSVVEGDRRSVPGMVRISFGMYNIQEEIDLLATALEHIAEGAYEGIYEQDRATGEYNAVGWEPDLSEYFKI